MFESQLLKNASDLVDRMSSDDLNELIAYTSNKLYQRVSESKRTLDKFIKAADSVKEVSEALEKVENEGKETPE